ncbi:MAG: ABC transporter permease [Spirochaetaceae bacterium]|nr:ABC transporter permease [Spirochaetaceae bacterium]
MSLINLLPSILLMAAPIVVASLGGLICEKSGVVNIGIEGLLNIGAFTAALVHFYLEATTSLSLPIALLAACAAGTLFSLIHAFTCVTMKANQIISGTGINLLASGITVFFCQLIFNMDRTAPFRFGFTVGPFGFYPTAYLALAFFIATWYLLYKRKFGLRLRACGEYPQAAQSAGINVVKMQYFGVLASGFAAGLAGAFIVLSSTIQYDRNLISGTGFIALAAISFGRFIPKGVASAGLLFGTASAIVFAPGIQTLRQYIPGEFFSSLPYLLTLVSLIIFGILDNRKKQKIKAMA